MFDRFLRFAEARRALAREDFAQALELLADPLVREHRKAVELRAEVLQAWLARAQRRQGAGELALALDDAKALLQREPAHGPAQEFAARLERQRAEVTTQAAGARAQLAKAEQAAGAGDLAGALRLLAELDPLARASAEADRLAKSVASRDQAARDARREAEQRLAAGEPLAARDLVLRARALDRTSSETGAVAARVAARLCDLRLPEAETLATAGRFEELATWLAAERAALPEVQTVPRFAALEREAAAGLAQRIVSAVANGEFSTALAIATASEAKLRHRPELAAVTAAAADLGKGLRWRDSGEVEAAAAALRSAAKVFDSPALRDLARELDASASALQEALTAARTALRAGDLHGAHERLLAALAVAPGHAVVRDELGQVETALRRREQQIGEARQLAAAGRLRAAREVLASLGSAGAGPDDGAALARELDSKLDVVQRGVHQVETALHGRDSASLEGLRHCLHRLEQLETVQQDSSELQRLRTALQAEIAGVDQIELASQAAQAGDRAAVAGAAAALGELCPKLLGPDRLLARLQVLTDLVGEALRSEVARGNVHAAMAWIEPWMAIGNLAGVSADRSADCVQDLTARVAAAGEAAQAGEQALARRDLAAAESAFDRGRLAAADEPALLRLGESLRRLRLQARQLDHAEALASAADVHGAQQKLAGMPPTPPVLRTRIFDLKQNLARAQGLERAFLLRVDEAGEFLVLRADSVTIGNLRDGSSDLPILANLAGRHARIQRSISFHGGMQDRIVAEKGEVAVNSEPVTDQVLRTGDRIRLGPVLELLYEVPNARSLTARLSLRGSFQVGGAQRVLLLKDRGRDGRILIGPGTDAHVRVAQATAEVELYGAKDGQMKVRCTGQGTMNGKPFSGEHPIVAGALVKVGGAAFSLLPWAPH